MSWHRSGGESRANGCCSFRPEECFEETIRHWDAGPAVVGGPPGARVLLHSALPQYVKEGGRVVHDAKAIRPDAAVREEGVRAKTVRVPPPVVARGHVDLRTRHAFGIHEKQREAAHVVGPHENGRKIQSRGYRQHRSYGGPERAPNDDVDVAFRCSIPELLDAMEHSHTKSVSVTLPEKGSDDRRVRGAHVPPRVARHALAGGYCRPGAGAAP